MSIFSPVCLPYNVIIPQGFIWRNTIITHRTCVVALIFSFCMYDDPPCTVGFYPRVIPLPIDVCFGVCGWSVTQKRQLVSFKHYLLRRGIQLKYWKLQHSVWNKQTELKSQREYDETRLKRSNMKGKYKTDNLFCLKTTCWEVRVSSTAGTSSILRYTKQQLVNNRRRHWTK